MNRADWKALSTAIRSQARNPDLNWRNPRNVQRETISHGETWFAVDCVRELGKPTVLTVRPSIIRDRSITARIAEELAWSRFFRMRRLPGSLGRERDHIAARGCIADARAIRLAASPFQRLP